MSISVRLAVPDWAVSIANGLHEAADARLRRADELTKVGSLYEAQQERGMESHYRWLADQFGEAAERLPVNRDGQREACPEGALP